MFKSQKTRQLMVNIILVELGILLGMFLFGHIQDVNNTKKAVQALNARVQAAAVYTADLDKQLQETKQELNICKQDLQQTKEELKACAENQIPITCVEPTQPTEQRQSCPCTTSCSNENCNGQPAEQIDSAPPVLEQCNPSPQDQVPEFVPTMHRVDVYYGSRKAVFEVPPE